MVPKLGQILKQRTGIGDNLLEKAIASSQKEKVTLGTYLIEKCAFSEEDVYRALAEQFSMEFLPGLDELIHAELIRELPSDLFREGRCFPLKSPDEGPQRFAVSDPLDLEIILQVQVYSDRVVETVLTTPSEMERMHKKLFGGNSLFSHSASRITREYERQIQTAEDSLTLDEIRKRTESEPVVKMATLIFDEAIKLRASDIHIEPSEHNAIIRFRIDGMLRQHTEISKWMYIPLTSRIKIQADLDIAEKRIPQDGRIRYTSGGDLYDFRVSTLPTHHGEKTVIRILKHDTSLLELVNLGVPKVHYDSILEIIEKPQGMLFVTGPTGSGKSSTLFACLNKIRRKAINITTIENPIEYKLDGINQVQINEKAGVTFATVLRSILRQDPDVILVGEIRDGETANIAVQASQTGHLVLSTLHTNDSVSAITRLRDLGVPPFLISSSLLAILAQRLVRVLCPQCRRKSEMTIDTKRKWETLLGNTHLSHCWSAPGCQSCGGTGYRGRTGVFELVTVNEQLRSMIADNASETAIRKILRENNFETMIQDGIAKIEAGITTPEELLRVVLVEEIAPIPNENGKTPPSQITDHNLIDFDTNPEQLPPVS